MKIRKITFTAALISIMLALFLCLTGCGNKDGDPTVSPSPTPTSQGATPAVTPDESTPEASLPDESTPEVSLPNESTPIKDASTPDTPSESTPAASEPETDPLGKQTEPAGKTEVPETEEPDPLDDITETFTYDFNNTINGNAAGVITYSATDAGTYYMYWDSDSPAGSEWNVPGQLFYEYEPFATVEAANGERIAVNVHEWTLLPEDATRVLVCYGEEKTAVFAYEIPEEKQFARGEPKYSFGSISDVHQGNRYGSPQTSIDSFTTALDLLAKNGVSLVAISGDITVNGTEAEYKQYKDIVDAFCAKNPNVNVYSTTGNHDLPGWSNLWPIYGVGSDNYTGELEIKRYSGNDYDYTVSIGGDIFIFLTQRNASYGGSTRMISEEQMAWLRARVEENTGKNIYLYFHTFLNDENGDASNGYYEYDLPFTRGRSDDIELRALLSEHKNVIMFTGHSHWILSMQDAFDAGEGRYNYNANIANGNGEYGMLVHNPSVSEPRGLTGNNSSRDELHGQKSEGYLVRVYDDCIVLYGYDFKNDKIMIKYSYIIDRTEKSTVEASDLADTVWTYTSKTSSGRLTVDGDKATLVTVINGSRKSVSGEFSIDGQYITVGSTKYKVFFSDASEGSMGIVINGTKRPFLKDALRSSLLK